MTAGDVTGTQDDETRTEESRDARYFRPRVDICERDDGLLVRADLPGVKAGDVEVRYEDGEIRIDGRVDRLRSADREFVLNEYDVGDFHRAFRVGDAIDAGGVTAEMTDGVLTLRLPKKVQQRVRRIAVGSGSPKRSARGKTRKEG